MMIRELLWRLPVLYGSVRILWAANRRRIALARISSARNTSSAFCCCAAWSSDDMPGTGRNRPSRYRSTMRADRTVLVLLECDLTEIGIRLLALLRLDDGDAREQADELLDLRPVDLAPGEHVGRRCDADHLRLDVTGGFEQLLVPRGRLDLAAAGQRAEHGILQAQPAGDRIGECHAVVLEDGCQPDVQHPLVVFAVDEDCRTRLRHGAEPVLAERVRGAEVQLSGQHQRRVPGLPPMPGRCGDRDRRAFPGGE